MWLGTCIRYYRLLVPDWIPILQLRLHFFKHLASGRNKTCLMIWDIAAGSWTQGGLNCDHWDTTTRQPPENHCTRQPLTITIVYNVYSYILYSFVVGLNDSWQQPTFSFPSIFVSPTIKHALPSVKISVHYTRSDTCAGQEVWEQDCVQDHCPLSPPTAMGLCVVPWWVASWAFKHFPRTSSSFPTVSGWTPRSRDFWELLDWTELN